MQADVTFEEMELETNPTYKDVPRGFMLNGVRYITVYCCPITGTVYANTDKTVD